MRSVHSCPVSSCLRAGNLQNSTENAVPSWLWGKCSFLPSLSNKHELTAVLGKTMRYYIEGASKLYTRDRAQRSWGCPCLLSRNSQTDRNGQWVTTLSFTISLTNLDFSLLYWGSASVSHPVYFTMSLLNVKHLSQYCLLRGGLCGLVATGWILNIIWSSIVMFCIIWVTPYNCSN